MTPSRRGLAAGLVLIAAIVGTACPTAGRAADAGLRPVTVARGLAYPWGLAFLPDGRMLVTERPGRMRIVAADGTLGAPLRGLPAVESGGQAGLLDVALGPTFATDRRVYWSYLEADPARPRDSGIAVARGRLGDDALTDVQVIFRAEPKIAGHTNLGSRLVFAPDGRLFVTVGDRFDHRDDAQRLDNDFGKTIRIEADGGIPPDNPFVGRRGARPAIWSYGQRNAQGAAIEPATGELWQDEHGPQGGDELNVVLAGRNYGWPVITYGGEYGSGAPIGEGTAKAGMEQPLTYWVPSIATSGLAFLTSDRYPGWRGNAFVGGLRGRLLVRLQLDGRRIVRQQRLLEDFGERIRDVRQGPDGWLYLLTDSADGRIVRLER